MPNMANSLTFSEGKYPKRKKSPLKIHLITCTSDFNLHKLFSSVNSRSYVIWMEKNWAGPFFPHHDCPAEFFFTQITTCTRLMLYLVRVGKEWAGPVFPHPLKSKGCLHIHDKVRLILSLVEWGKNGPAQFFHIP